MTDQANAPDFTDSPTPLALIALELGITVEAVEAQLAPRYIFVASGFRCCTPFAAAELLRAHRERKEQAEADAIEAAAAARARHEATRAAARAERANLEPRVQQFGLRTIEVRPDGGDDVPAVAAMMARAGAATEYDGVPSTRRPSRLDWLTGKGEGGASLGPTTEQMKRDALARKQARKDGGK